MSIVRTNTPRWGLLLALLLTLVAPVQSAFARPTAAQHSRSAHTAPASPGALAAGTAAVVDADGDCLRLRGGPGRALPELRCLPHGSPVTAIPGRVVVDGTAWQQVRVGEQIGWVAEMYLREVPAGTALPTAPAISPAAVPAPASAPSAAAVPPIGPGCTAITSTPARAGAAQGPTVAPGITGAVPDSGTGLVVWGGGSMEQVAAASAERGCSLRSVWAPAADGGFIGYIYDAPEVVNADWLERYGPSISAGTPLLLVCGGAITRQAITAPKAAPTATLPPPAPTGSPPLAIRALPPPPVSASAVAIVDAASGAVIYERNGHRTAPPASLTKIATAILTVESRRLDAWVPVTVDSREMGDSSVMGLRPGDCFRERDLLYGLMLPSGNDAALALGRFQAGSDDAFVGRMNALVLRLGLGETHFENAHGLNASGHYSSAYDLAMLARYAMTLPDFAGAVSARQWTALGSRTIALTNTNTMLGGYLGADGVKTGFTEEAGRTMVASATRDGRRVFIALLNAPDRDADARKLFDWTFANFLFR